MKVVRLSIERFRGIKNAELSFDGHTLLIGMNNVGKSTVCEALDLVLGPDRLRRNSPVEEFNFYNAQYLDGEGNSLPTQIEVLLTELTPEVERLCATHIELWKIADRRLLGEGEADLANTPGVVRCLRLKTVAQYDADEDEFAANTFFAHGTRNPDGELESVGKNIKRLIGFLYLRALRTGSRALSLERGS